MKVIEIRQYLISQILKEMKRVYKLNDFSLNAYKELMQGRNLTELSEYLHFLRKEDVR